MGIVGGGYGVGGGAMIAPFFVSFFNLPVYTVAGAGLMGTFITSVVGVISYEAIAPFYPNVSIAPDWILVCFSGSAEWRECTWERGSRNSWRPKPSSGCSQGSSASPPGSTSKLFSAYEKAFNLKNQTLTHPLLSELSRMIPTRKATPMFHIANAATISIT